MILLRVRCAEQRHHAIALDLDVKGMALGEVMQFVSGEQKITGNTDLILNVTGAGDAWPSISKTLAGSGAVAVRDGLIRQIRLVPESASSVGIAGVAPLKPLDGKLESLTATFNGERHARRVAQITTLDQGGTLQPE